MSHKVATILLVCLITVFVSSGQSWAKSKKEIPAPPKSEENDEVAKQYLMMQCKINSDIEEENRKIPLHKMEVASLQEQLLLCIQTHHRAEAARVEQKQKEVYSAWDASNKRIDGLKKDKDKLKMDALKYYKGKLPGSFSKEWEKEELAHYGRLPQD